MVIARKIAYNVLVSSVSKILSTVLALIAIGFITRYLGRDGFGNYATILAFLSFFGAAGDLGFNSISAREISREGANEEKIMSDLFTLRVLVSFLVFLFSPVLAWFLPYPNEVRLGIIIVAASFFFSSSYQILNGVFQKKLAMDKVAVSELLGKAVQVGLIILAVKLGMGLNWVVAALLFHMMFSFSLIFLWAGKYIKIRPSIDVSYWKKFIKESYPIGVSAVIVFIYFKIDTIFLSLIKSSSDVGIYNAAYKVVENIIFFPAMIMGLIFPIMSRSIFSKPKEFKGVADKTFKIFVLAAVPLVVGGFFLSKNIIALIGGAQFLESSPVLKILVFSMAAIFFGNFFNSILIAGNLQKKLMIVLGAAAILNVSFNLFLIPRFSYFGAAFVSVGTEFLVAIASGILVFKRLGYSPNLKNWVGIGISGLSMAAFLFFFSEWNFFAKAFFSLLVYGFCLWLFKSVKTSEITSIISREDRKAPSQTLTP